MSDNIATRERIQVGDTILEICPELGGSITQFCIQRDNRDIAILRRTTATTPDILDTACFPLVPYSGRISGAVFDFKGQQIRQPALPQFQPNAIHGHGWLSSWELSAREEQADSARLKIEYHHEPDLWPWAYSATQTFEVRSRLLRIETSITNHSDTTMPAGLGLHPYFPAGHGAEIKTKNTGMWSTDAAVLPTEHTSLAADHPFNQAILSEQISLDNVFTGWCGHAAINWPDQDLAVELRADTDYLIIFTPPGEDFFCVEPATHPADSLRTLDAREQPDTDQDTGLGSYLEQTIDTGKSLTMTMELRIKAG